MLKRLVILVSIAALVSSVGILTSQTAPSNTPPKGVIESNGTRKGQPDPASQRNDQSAIKAPPAVAKVEAPNVEPSRTDDYGDEAAKKLALYTFWLMAFTGLLVGVGFLQAMALVLQARLLKQHAGHLENVATAADASSENIRKTLVEIQRQAEIMEKQAQAAKVSAEAANAQIQMMKDKERARIEITHQDGSESMTIFTRDIVAMGSFRINLNNMGGTMARNVQVEFDAFASDAAEAPPSKEMFWVAAPATVNSGVAEQTGPLPIDGRFPHDEIPSTFFVYCRGIITYNDIFKKEPNVTRFLMRREFMRGRDGEAYSNVFWESCGAPADNEST
jgi:hypothetical protein